MKREEAARRCNSVSALLDNVVVICAIDAAVCRTLGTALPAPKAKPPGFAREAREAGRLPTGKEGMRAAAPHTRRQTRSIAIAMPWPTPMHIVHSA
ncbi:hypothetical protein [Burkholderia ubonensis]|uniref:hypothetical protein n=1 Tax=Burkholderia ubonensis TaxID=101571 RepID=UPI000F56998F|nr:hypothetical protein [Burkholderia ubonensis]